MYKVVFLHFYFLFSYATLKIINILGFAQFIIIYFSYFTVLFDQIFEHHYNAVKIHVYITVCVVCTRTHVGLEEVITQSHN